MVQEQIGGIDGESIGIRESVIGSDSSGVEAKRSKIRFARANSSDADTAFRSDSKPRRSRAIPKEKRSEVTISDTRPENAQKVKGRPPKLPEEEDTSAPRKRTIKGKSQLYPSLVDAENQARFLLSAIEVAAVTAAGPTGEMSDWERGMLQAPLQRCLARIPLDVLAKGGLAVDIGFLAIGSAIYLSRVSRGIKLPQFGKSKAKAGTVQEDDRAPVSAPAHAIVDDIKAGDRDGLAVPVPNIIQQHMNGAI